MASLTNRPLYDAAIEMMDSLNLQLADSGHSQAAAGAAEARRLLEFFSRFDESAEGLIVRVVGCLRSVIASNSVFPGEKELHRGARLAADQLYSLL
jgi:hypothetical protein